MSGDQQTQLDRFRAACQSVVDGIEVNNDTDPSAPKARPGEALVNGKCPVCDKEISRTAAYQHVHTCRHQQLVQKLAEAYAATNPFACPCQGCDNVATSIKDAMSHLTLKHARRLNHASFPCFIGGATCGTFSETTGLELHFEVAHGYLCYAAPPSTKTVIRSGLVEYCETCHVWLVGRGTQLDHFEGHLKDDEHTLSVDAMAFRPPEGQSERMIWCRCPFCYYDRTKSAKERCMGMPLNWFTQHLARHIHDMPTGSLITCPHPICAGAEGRGKADLAQHLIDAHGLPMLGSGSNRGTQPQVVAGDCSNLPHAPAIFHKGSSPVPEGLRTIGHSDVYSCESTKYPGLVVTNFTVKGLQQIAKSKGVSSFKGRQTKSVTKLCGNLGVLEPAPRAELIQFLKKEAVRLRMRNSGTVAQLASRVNISIEDLPVWKHPRYKNKRLSCREANAMTAGIGGTQNSGTGNEAHVPDTTGEVGEAGEVEEADQAGMAVEAETEGMNAVEETDPETGGCSDGLEPNIIMNESDDDDHDDVDVMDVDVDS